MVDKKRMRARTQYTLSLTAVVVFLLFLVDPDSGFIQNLPFGASAIATLVTAIRPIIVITLIHYTRKWIFDYVDIGDIYDSVMGSDNAVAKALFAIAMAIFTLGFAIVFAVSLRN